MRRLGLAGAFVISMLAITCPSSAFSVDGCVASSTSPDLVASFRVTLGAARIRCTAAAGRIARLSKAILGIWTSRDGRGRQIVMIFSPDRKVSVTGFNNLTKQMEIHVQKWAFQNTYGMKGSDELSFDGGTLTDVKISGASMTFTSQPTDTTMVAHWHRAQ